MKSIILFVMAASSISLAGVFSSEPPKEFLSLPVTCAYCGGNWFTLDNLLKHGFSPQAKQSWEKIDDSQWLLKVVVDDKVSGNRTKFNVLFEKSEGVANVSRININGEDAGPAVFPNMLAPMRDSVWAKVGAPKEETSVAKTSSKKSQKTKLVWPNLRSQKICRRVLREPILRNIPRMLAHLHFQLKKSL